MSISRRLLLGSLIVALLIAVAIGAAFSLRSDRRLPEGLIQANGRIESDTVVVASKLAGRIISLAAREGDLVKAEQALARIDDKAARARLDEALAAFDMARARTASLRAALGVLRQEVPNTIAMAQAALVAAEAGLAKAQAGEHQDRRDAERARKLVADQFMNIQAAEKADLAWRVAQDQLLAARAARDQVERTLRDARLGPDRIRAKEVELVMLEAATREAAARIAQAQSTLDDLTVTAPLSGTVTARFANAGEIVNGGSPLFEIVDLDRLYLKVYVPEAAIGKVRRGLPARIYTDAFPEQPFAATVRYIGARAEFTPKEVQTPDERVKLVYEVRLYLEANPDHRLTPGLPADAVIRWREDVAWQKPQW